MIKYIPLLLLVLVTSCKPEFAYRNINEFDVNDTLIPNNTPVLVQYCSGAPDFNEQFSYYIHMIAVNMDTKDTFNLLTTSIFTVQKDDNLATFITPEQKMAGVPAELKDSVALVLNQEIDQVISNVRMSVYEVNDFPTVIGYLEPLPNKEVGTETK